MGGGWATVSLPVTVSIPRWMYSLILFIVWDFICFSLCIVCTFVFQYISLYSTQVGRILHFCAVFVLLSVATAFLTLPSTSLVTLSGTDAAVESLTDPTKSPTDPTNLLLILQTTFLKRHALVYLRNKVPFTVTMYIPL